MKRELEERKKKHREGLKQVEAGHETEQEDKENCVPDAKQKLEVAVSDAKRRSKASSHQWEYFQNDSPPR